MSQETTESQSSQPTKKTKYNNNKIMRDGLKFDSEAEALRYSELKMQERAGKIADLKCQVRFPIEMFSRATRRHEVVCRYVADFTYLKDGALVVEDVKSTMTAKLPVYRLKLKLMRHVLGIEVREIVS